MPGRAEQGRGAAQGSSYLSCGHRDHRRAQLLAPCVSPATASASPPCLLPSLSSFTSPQPLTPADTAQPEHLEALRDPSEGRVLRKFKPILPLFAGTSSQPASTAYSCPRNYTALLSSDSITSWGSKLIKNELGFWSVCCTHL